MKPAEKIKELNFRDFDYIKITIASPEQIKSWAADKDRGKVQKSETINYRTGKYEKDGLFCEKIFGPARDNQCACGKYKLTTTAAKIVGVCQRCGVEITSSEVRRTRMGYIELAAPVAHTWFLRKQPSKIGTLLDMDLSTLERIVYYVDYVILEDVKDTKGSIVIYEEEIDGKKVKIPLKERTVLSSSQYQRLKKEFKEKLRAETGAGALRKLLEKIDLPKERDLLREQLSKEKSEQKRIEIIKKLKVVEGFIKSGAKPEWMILTVLPVIPPALRPITPLEGGKYASSDLNDLYRRVINRNNRIYQYERQKTPELMILINNEKRLLQEAVDALFEGIQRQAPLAGAGSRVLRSLTDILKGKQGRFRQNLLGKRVDYSGRSVITVNPELKLNECGLSKEMALELYKPFVIKELLAEGIQHPVVRRMIAKGVPQVYEVLERVVKSHPILLNRAPTLHRMGIQAFYPKLIDEKVIQIHPMVCTAYNADFDGDQMAVHLPLTPEAILESKLQMLAPHNIFSPAFGKPIVSPTQDAIVGFAYLTKEKSNEKGEGMIFKTSEEVIYAHEQGIVDLHAKIKLLEVNKLFEPHFEDKQDVYDVKKWQDYTTVGRVIFNQILPHGLRFVNKEVDKKLAAELVENCYKKYGVYRTFLLLDDMKELGFRYATISGMTISTTEMVIPEAKEEIIKKAKEMVMQIESEAKSGAITESERYEKILDIWTSVTERIADLMFEEMKKMDYEEKKPDKPHFNSIYLMAQSGARGNPQQVRQLSGMRGLMARPQRKITGEIGEIIETPITSNFKEGLSVLEYFISTHGGRKGLVDTALKTADAGYLTRRLVIVSHNVFITTEDCGTLKGIKVSELRSGDELIESLEERITGRVALQNITSLTPNEKGEYEIFVREGEVITPESAKKVVEAGIVELQIRSVLTCEADYGVCAKCYGIDLSTQRLVEVGTPVGIIAAQSIGEPGTQLTLRTFHVGGTAVRLTYKSEIVASEDSQVEFQDVRTIEDRHGNLINLTRNAKISLKSVSTKKREIFQIPYGAKIKVSENKIVREGTLVAEWDPYGLPIVAEADGVIRYRDIIEGKTLRLEKSKITGTVEKTIATARGEKLNPRLEIINPKTKKVLKTYLLPTDTILTVNDHQEVAAGDTLAKIPQEIIKIKDITGGLPRVIELVEARHPKNKAIISEIDGVVSLKTTEDGLPIVTIIPEKGKAVEYAIPRGRHLVVYEGDKIQAGEPLTDGVIDPHDIARVKRQYLAEFLVNEIQRVYRLQGVVINDKHIEIIVKQMLSNVRIVDSGSSTFIPNTIVSYREFQRERKRLEEEKKRIAKEVGRHEAAKIKLPEAEPVLLGITEASLTSESFITAAAFQEVVRVLTDAAAEGSIDYLRGIKENVVVGRYIPVGTTAPCYRLPPQEIIMEKVPA